MTEHDERRAGLSVEARSGSPSYYEKPVLKEPVWIWAVPAYFFVGGVAGAAAVLGAAAQGGGLELRGLVGKCRRLSLGGVILGSGLLVYDLGRPERFLNMLRVFRPTSPLSVGSWVLAGAGPLSALSNLLFRRSGPARILGDAAGAAAGVLGLPLAGYTAVLLSQTAVPVWQEAGTTLPWLFVWSSVSSAAAALSLTDLTDAEARVVSRFGAAGRAGEVVAAWLVEREAGASEETGRALKGGVAGSLWKSSKAMGITAAVLPILPGGSRGRRKVAALMTILGSLATRFSLLYAGRASARDPHATFKRQRRQPAGS